MDAWNSCVHRVYIVGARGSGWSSQCLQYHDVLQHVPTPHLTLIQHVQWLSINISLLTLDTQ